MLHIPELGHCRIPNKSRLMSRTEPVMVKGSFCVLERQGFDVVPGPSPGLFICRDCVNLCAEIFRPPRLRVSHVSRIAAAEPAFGDTCCTSRGQRFAASSVQPKTGEYANGGSQSGS